MNVDHLNTDAEIFPWRLDGRVALVTGGSSGIGLATCELFARAGAKVGVLSRSADEVDEVVASLRNSKCLGDDCDAMPLVADVSKPDEVTKAIDKIVGRWRRLDAVIANAGINGTWAPLEELRLDEWNETLGANLTGAFLTLQKAMPHLKKSRGAAVITASVNGTRIFSNSGATAYSCSKAGQVALAKMVALEVARDGVRVNVVCPGAVDTPIHAKTNARNLEQVKQDVEFGDSKIPLTHGEQPDPIEVARLILFLVSDASRHITGTEIWIDGGQSLLMG